jgi:glycosyltransferase involved in cell wall biosynthesis
MRTSDPPLLTVYIPTYRRPEIARLLSSLADQLTAEVEVIISDNDSSRSAFTYVEQYLNAVQCKIMYSARATNIGGDANVVRGLSQGSAPWLWLLGDDDEVLPDSIRYICEAIKANDCDRIILLTQEAPRLAAGFHGDVRDLASVDPSLLVAATLMSSNVVRRSRLSIEQAYEHLDSKYGHSWANVGCRIIRVLDEPCITVGTDHPGEGYPADFRKNQRHILRTLLTEGYRVNATLKEAFAWNFAHIETASWEGAFVTEHQEVSPISSSTSPETDSAELNRISQLAGRLLRERDHLESELLSLRNFPH